MTRRNSWTVTGIWLGEDISATFTATAERDWVGHPDVPGGLSETTESIMNVELSEMTIMGHDVPLSALPDVVKDSIREMHTEIDKWEPEE